MPERPDTTRGGPGSHSGPAVFYALPSGASLQAADVKRHNWYTVVTVRIHDTEKAYHLSGLCVMLGWGLLERFGGAEVMSGWGEAVRVGVAVGVVGNDVVWRYTTFWV